MIEKIKRYFKNILIGFDQLANVVFLNGYPDETLSSHFYRWNRDGVFKEPMWILDKIALCFGDYNHCYESYKSEQERRQMPPELRDKPSEEKQVIEKD